MFAYASVLDRPCSPDLSWNHDVHFTQEALLYHRSVLVCQLSARKKRTGNFFAGRGAGEGGKPFAQNKETRAILQQHRPYWHMKVARYSFFRVNAKFEHKLRRHKQTLGKIATTVDENLS